MAVESLVRPFVTRNRFSDKRIPTQVADPKSKTAGTPCSPHLCWGDVGTKPTPLPDGLSVETNDCNETNGEISGRNSVPHRIENPDDSSQYFMVLRPKTIYFKHTDSKKSTWNDMSLVAADVTAWEADLEADLGFNTDDAKCKMKMTLNAPDKSDVS